MRRGRLKHLFDETGGVGAVSRVCTAKNLIRARSLFADNACNSNAVDDMCAAAQRQFFSAITVGL